LHKIYIFRHFVSIHTYIHHFSHCVIFSQKKNKFTSPIRNQLFPYEGGVRVSVANPELAVGLHSPIRNLLFPYEPPYSEYTVSIRTTPIWTLLFPYDAMSSHSPIWTLLFPYEPHLFGTNCFHMKGECG